MYISAYHLLSAYYLSIYCYKHMHLLTRFYGNLSFWNRAWIFQVLCHVADCSFFPREDSTIQVSRINLPWGTDLAYANNFCIVNQHTCGLCTLILPIICDQNTRLVSKEESYPWELESGGPRDTAATCEVCDSKIAPPIPLTGFSLHWSVLVNY